MVKHDSSLQSPMAVSLHHSSWRLALRMEILGLSVDAQPWKPISWRSRQTVIVLTLLPEAVWNLVVSVATEDKWFLHTTRFNTQRFGSVSLCRLPLHGLAVVALRCFHLTITALIVDRGTSSRAEILWTDLLERWHPYDSATLKAPLKVTELFSKAILLPMFVYGDCVTVCSILYTWQERVWLK
jgi:hypothetical protein